MSTTFTSLMTFHTILIIKIVFTFLRTIWRTHSVLPFIITTMMTIIILSLHALIHIINYLSSFRLIIHCYHIHMIEWSKSTGGFQSYHMLLPHSFQGMEQIQYDEFQDISSIIYYFCLNHHFIVIMVDWDSNSMSYPYIISMVHQN